MAKTRKKKSSSTRIFFTSDLWLGRNNIIDIYKRPFSSVEEMNSTIIEKWNTTVNNDDIVFVLGNCVYDGTHAQNILADMRGTKVMMLSESDKNILRVDDVYLDEITLLGEIYKTHFFNDKQEAMLYDTFGLLTSEETLNSISNIAETFHPDVIFLKDSIVDLARYGITLSLYPLLEWNGKKSGTMNLHGGTLESSKDLKNERRLSVRTDFWGFRPIGLSEVQTIIKQLTQ